MKKLLLIALALNFVACSNDDSTENTTSAIAPAKKETFNPNPTPQDYLNAKHPDFMASIESLKKESPLSGSTAKTQAFVSTYVPDTAFRNAIVNMGAAQDANPGDQWVEVDTTRGGLYIAGLGITDLTGINGFTGLKQLIVSGNNLSTINVSGLANLEWIECQQNQLTTLNLSANTKLQQVWCHLNQLTSLVLPSSPTLFGVWCYSNQLATLNLNNNTGITQLFIQGNQLTSFNFAPFVNIEQMNVSNNKWVTLNFNSNPKIKSIWSFSITTLTDLSIKNGANTLVTIQDFTGNTKRPPIHVDASFLPNANTAWPNRGASTYVL
ncbi:hypothetical protein [Flavobacterium sp. GSB-24]|uniref:leucine-rich repeat domain-containing protein n=1 Tax=Flavobacterium sp. GSB-24 TaxID=2994319 RepID=UPI002492606E|nr:hypothetical protein [Flavobacterium sp. GSB-24]BDU27705.1 hypothetical protein FLGSB24_44490 [Flavobacterium sp. GSB-24]